MADAARIHCVGGCLDAADAVVAAGLKTLPVRGVEKVYSPHFWFIASGCSPTLFGRRDFSIDCLVDACSGDAATADRFSIAEEVPDGLVLPSTWSAEDAERAAIRRTLANLTRQLRTLADFHVSFEARGLIYKPCWLVSDAGENLLIDALTGAWYSVPTAVDTSATPA